MKVQTNKKLRVKRIGAAGDVLLLEPVLSILVGSGYEVELLTANPDVLKGMPGLKCSPLTSLGEGEIDIDFDMVYERNPSVHITEAYMEHIGIDKSFLRKPKFYTESLMEEDNNPIVISVDTRHHQPHRQINGLSSDDWSSITTYLEDTTKKQVIVVSANLSYCVLNHESHLRKATPTMEALINTIRSASLFIGNDSLPAHIANSLNIPSLIFMGSVNPEYRFTDIQPDFHIMQNGCEFSGCYHKVVGIAGADCVLEGKEKVKCCTFTKAQIIRKLSSII